jgi:hypothetical protein
MTDPAPLREAIARDNLAEFLSDWFDRIPGFEDTGNGTIRGRYPIGFNDVEFDHIALAQDILAALPTDAVQPVGDLASIADSLKRIADTLDGTAAGICINETIFAGRQS